jgi:hypothetical protein
MALQEVGDKLPTQVIPNNWVYVHDACNLNCFATFSHGAPTPCTCCKIHSVRCGRNLGVVWRVRRRRLQHNVAPTIDRYLKSRRETFPSLVLLSRLELGAPSYSRFMKIRRTIPCSSDVEKGCTETQPILTRVWAPWSRLRRWLGVGRYPPTLDEQQQLVMFGHSKDRSVHAAGLAVSNTPWSSRPVTHLHAHFRSERPPVLIAFCPQLCTVFEDFERAFRRE